MFWNITFETLATEWALSHAARNHNSALTLPIDSLTPILGKFVRQNFCSSYYCWKVIRHCWLGSKTGIWGGQNWPKMWFAINNPQSITSRDQLFRILAESFGWIFMPRNIQEKIQKLSAYFSPTHPADPKYLWRTPLGRFLPILASGVLATITSCVKFGIGIFNGFRFTWA